MPKSLEEGWEDGEGGEEGRLPHPPRQWWDNSPLYVQVLHVCVSGLPFVAVFLTLTHTCIHTPVLRGRSASLWIHTSPPVDAVFSADRTNACALVIKAAVTGFSSEASSSLSLLLLQPQLSFSLYSFSNFSALSRSHITGGSIVLQEEHGESSHDHITPIFSSLPHWLPIHVRTAFKVTCKVLNGQAPSYLSDLFKTSYSILSKNTGLLSVLRVKKTSAGCRAFS